jgi:excisionase family DNA binding protein
MTVEELAVLLRVNRKTVYDAIGRGEIPGARRVGGTYRILREAVINWFTSGQGRVSRSRRTK